MFSTTCVLVLHKLPQVSGQLVIHLAVLDRCIDELFEQLPPCRQASGHGEARTDERHAIARAYLLDEMRWNGSDRDVRHVRCSCSLEILWELFAMEVLARYSAVFRRLL